MHHLPGFIPVLVVLFFVWRAVAGAMNNAKNANAAAVSGERPQPYQTSSTGQGINADNAEQVARLRRIVAERAAKSGGVGAAAGVLGAMFEAATAGDGESGFGVLNAFERVAGGGSEAAVAMATQLVTNAVIKNAPEELVAAINAASGKKRKKATSHQPQPATRYRLGDVLPVLPPAPSMHALSARPSLHPLAPLSPLAG